MVQSPSWCQLKLTSRLLHADGTLLVPVHEGVQGQEAEVGPPGPHLQTWVAVEFLHFLLQQL